jgi:hypothetical protein
MDAIEKLKRRSTTRKMNSLSLAVVTLPEY